MLDFSRTQIVEMRDFTVQTGYTVTAEGAAISTDNSTAGVVGVNLFILSINNWLSAGLKIEFVIFMCF